MLRFGYNRGNEAGKINCCRGDIVSIANKIKECGTIKLQVGGIQIGAAEKVLLIDKRGQDIYWRFDGDLG